MIQGQSCAHLSQDSIIHHQHLRPGAYDIAGLMEACSLLSRSIINRVVVCNIILCHIMCMRVCSMPHAQAAEAAMQSVAGLIQCKVCRLLISRLWTTATQWVHMYNAVPTQHKLQMHMGALCEAVVSLCTGFIHISAHRMLRLTAPCLLWCPVSMSLQMH